jgi:hypothetical protein
VQCFDLARSKRSARWVFLRVDVVSVDSSLLLGRFLCMAWCEGSIIAYTSSAVLLPGLHLG